MHHTSRFGPDHGDSGASSSGSKRHFEKVKGDNVQGSPMGDKRQKLPALASVVVEAVKMDSLQKLCSSLEPILRKVVGEEVERALAKFVPNRLGARPLLHGTNVRFRVTIRLIEQVGAMQISIG